MYQGTQKRGGYPINERSGPELPWGYRLDEGQLDFVFLIRPDGSRAAVFSALGASKESIEDAAERDWRDRSLRNGEVKES